MPDLKTKASQLSERERILIATESVSFSLKLKARYQQPRKL